MPAVVWFRRDLRVHDHPPLVAALAEHPEVVPLFVLDPALLSGRFTSLNRTRYLFDCLAALDAELRARGGRLIVRAGRPEDVVPEVADGGPVYAAGDVSAFARRRDARVARVADLRLGPGLFIARLGTLRTGSGGPYRVFSPFRRAWEVQERRDVLRAPSAVPVPAGVHSDPLPHVDAPSLEDRPEPGEAAAVAAMERWLRSAALARYHERRGRLDEPTSRMSQYLHFGCLSPLRLEQRVAALGGRGPASYRSELAWRDFYGSVLLHELPSRPDPTWSDDADALEAWTQGRTGFPVVDAGMRQMHACGWMHNRARMIVASFLTKDLHLDWRLGEAVFMEHLIDGDVGNNNGGWQWVAGTGTDPHEWTRVFNPWLQQERFDPDGAYVRRWVPELRDVPLKRLSRPWEMTGDEQRAAGCVIGRDYPAPIVDHLEEVRTVRRLAARR